MEEISPIHNATSLAVGKKTDSSGAAPIQQSPIGQMDEPPCEFDGCCYCGRETDEDRAKHDKWIGYPDHMGEKGGPTVVGPEFALRLTDYSRDSRDEVIRALMTLLANGIGPAEIVRGSAVAPEEHRQIAREHFEAGKDTGAYGRRENAMTVIRVGSNFVDFEAPKHDLPPVSIFVQDSGPPDAYTYRRAREMGVEDARPNYRVIRVYDNYRLGEEDTSPLDEVTTDMESIIYGSWERGKMRRRRRD